MEERNLYYLYPVVLYDDGFKRAKVSYPNSNIFIDVLYVNILIKINDLLVGNVST
jgi:hypothetical protein